MKSRPISRLPVVFSPFPDPSGQFSRSVHRPSPPLVLAASHRNEVVFGTDQTQTSLVVVTVASRNLPTRGRQRLNL